MFERVINFPTSLDYCDAFCKYLMTSYPRENKSVTKCQFRHEEDLELVNLLHLSWYYEALVHTARALLIAVWLKFPSFPLTLREMGQKKNQRFCHRLPGKKTFFFSAACFTWMKDEFDGFENLEMTCCWESFSRHLFYFCLIG